MKESRSCFTNLYWKDIIDNCYEFIFQLVELFTTDKAGDKADFQDHTRKYLSKGYDKLKVYFLLLLALCFASVDVSIYLRV